MSNFENACLRVCNDWVNEIDCNIEPDYSKEHIKRIKDISKGKGYARFGGKKLRIFLVAAIVLLLNVTAFAAVQTKQIRLAEGFFGYRLTVENPERKGVKEIEYGYIPDGFQETNRKYEWTDQILRLEFSNGDQRFELAKMVENVGLGLSPNKEERMKRYEYNGVNYIYFEATEDMRSPVPILYWNNNGYMYSLVGYEDYQSFEDMVKIARDVK